MYDDRFIAINSVGKTEQKGKKGGNVKTAIFIL